jgi:hypothetical protein
MIYHVSMCLWCNEREVVGMYTREDGSGFCSGLCEEEALTEMALAELEFGDEDWCDDPEREFPHKLGTDGSCHTCAMAHEGDEPFDGFLTDAEADADVLASAGWGTDEDYGCYDSGDSYEY